MDAKHCSGCRENFYNDHNPLGIKKCWHLKNAKRVTRWKVYWWALPTTATKVRVPECMSQPGEYAYYNEKPTGAKG